MMPARHPLARRVRAGAALRRRRRVPYVSAARPGCRTTLHLTRPSGSMCDTRTPGDRYIISVESRTVPRSVARNGERERERERERGGELLVDACRA